MMRGDIVHVDTQYPIFRGDYHFWPCKKRVVTVLDVEHVDWPEDGRVYWLEQGRLHWTAPDNVSVLSALELLALTAKE